MKRHFVTLSVLGLLATTPVICWATSSYAANSGVEKALQSYGDLSMFYQAMLNTGVINELNENERYTIFAPTNAAFSSLPLSRYPCFYAVQCRPEIAQMLRDHIVPERHDLSDLVTYGSVQTLGMLPVHVTEPFQNDYAVQNQKILSQTEVHGNMVYRIDGPIVTQHQLMEFSAVPAESFTANNVTTEKTVIRKTYRTPATASAYPAGSMTTETVSPVIDPDNVSETTTVTKTYTTDTQ